MKLVVSNMTDDGLAYLKTQGDVRVEGTIITLANFRGDSSLVNAELVKKGISVREFSFEKSSLEEYFFKLIGDKK